MMRLCRSAGLAAGMSWLAVCLAQFGVTRVAVAQSSDTRNPSRGAQPVSAPVRLSTRDPDLNAADPPPTPMRNQAVASLRYPAKNAGANVVPADDPHAKIKVNGLTGTLNKNDVHQAMDARQIEFNTCIAQSRRTLKFVSGTVRYAFRVDAAGQVAVLRPTQSTIGHRELEECLTEVVRSTQFPKPAGRAAAEFSWGMSVEPAGEDAPTLPARKFAPLVRKRVSAVYRSCELRRRRARFHLTAYVTPSGTIASAGGFGASPEADEQLDCVLDQIEKWHVSKAARLSKVSFDMR
jgi:hypothetical protein